MKIEIQGPGLDKASFDTVQKGIETLVSQKVFLESSLTKINDKNFPQASKLEHATIVFTELDKIVEASRQIVLNVFLKTSDSLVKQENEPAFGSAMVFPFDLSSAI